MDQATSQLAPAVYPTSHPSRSVHSTSRSTPTDQDLSQPSQSVHSTSHSASTDQDSTQPAPTVQATSKKRSGCESTTHWIVDAIDSRDNVKKLKVKVREVLNLSGEECVIVNFYIFDEPFGDARSLLSGFCGILACDCFYFQSTLRNGRVYLFHTSTASLIKLLSPNSPLTQSSQLRVDMFVHLLERSGLQISTSCGSRPKTHLKVKMRLWIRCRRGRDQWISFVEYQYKDSTKEMRIRNTENRKKQTIPHTGGSKANATRRAEMMAETGQRPGRAQIYLATHKNKDGVYVNEAAKEICEKIESALSQSTIDESQISPNDAVGKVLGNEHSRRVRCMGLGVVPSRVFKQVRPRFGGTSASNSEGSCSSKCQENHNQMMNAHNQMMNAFKAYMIIKEGTIPEQFSGLFASPSTVSPTTPSDAASGPLSPMDARRSCGGSNPSDNL